MRKVLRDNKVLLQKIKKNTLLSDRCAMMSSGVGFAFSLKVDDYVVTTNRMSLYFKIPKDVYTWVEYKDFKQYTSKVVNDFVQEVFYLGGVRDEEYMVRLLQHCGISGVNMSNLYDYINDTSTYNLVLEVVLDEIRTFLTDVIYENLNTDNLYKSTGEDTKGVFFINKRYLGVVAVYLNKMINEVVLPNSCQLEKCDIFTGRNCHSDTISNYIKRGWKLPKTIDIGKQFKFREHSGYFITMNNW